MTSAPSLLPLFISCIYVDPPQDLKDAGLPLPAANQIELNPGIVPKTFIPYTHTETFESLLVTTAVVLQARWLPVWNNFSRFSGARGLLARLGARQTVCWSTATARSAAMARQERRSATVSLHFYLCLRLVSFSSQPFVAIAASIKAVAAAHNVSAAQAVLRWNVQQVRILNVSLMNAGMQAHTSTPQLVCAPQGIPVIPMATDPDYQAENLDIFGFEVLSTTITPTPACFYECSPNHANWCPCCADRQLTAQEMECMATLDLKACPPPPPPPLPTPAQAKCEFTQGPNTITLKALPQGIFTLKDRIGDSYAVTSPCGSISAQHTTAPAVEDVPGYQIPLGFLDKLTTAALPSHLAQQGGMRLIMGGGDGNPGCSPAGRILQYDMVCDKGGPAGAAPNSTVFIYNTPGRKVDPIAHCTCVVEWHHPAACPSKAG